jgi:hypothetical protein
VINKVLDLAQGHWTKDNAKQINGGDGLKGIQLFETRLNDYQRLLWERAVSFSPRLTSSSDSSVWTQCIRLWKVVSHS